MALGLFLVYVWVCFGLTTQRVSYFIGMSEDRFRQAAKNIHKSSKQIVVKELM